MDLARLAGSIRRIQEVIVVGLAGLVRCLVQFAHLMWIDWFALLSNLSSL